MIMRNDYEADRPLQERSRLVRTGWHGRVVNSFPNQSSTTYSVEFVPDEAPAIT
jgi:hypothetical protein